MVAITFGLARIASAKTAEAQTARKTFFARVLDALIEARRVQADREIRRHLHLLPYTFDGRGNRLIKGQSRNLPFGGW